MLSKKPLILLLAVILIGGGLYFSMGKKPGSNSTADLETKAIELLKQANKNEIEARLLKNANFSVDKTNFATKAVEVSTEKRTISYKNVTISMPSQEITIAEILEEGVSPEILLGSYGENSTVGNITLNGFSMKAEGMKATADKYVLEKTSGDYKALNASLTAETKNIADIRKALATFKSEKSSGSLSMEKEDNGVKVVCGSVSSGETSLTTTKDMNIGNIKASANGQTIFTIDSITATRYEDTSILNPAVGEFSTGSLENIYSDAYPMHLEGFRITNIKSALPMFPLSSKEFYVDAHITNETKIKMGLKELSVPKSLFAMVPELSLYASMLPGDINADLDFDLSFNPKSTPAAFDGKFTISDKMLGKFEYTVGMINNDPNPSMENLETFSVKSVIMSYTNTDISTLKKILPNGAADMLKERKSSAKGADAETIQAMMDLLDKGGKVVVTFTPKTPIPFGALMNTMDTMNFSENATVKYEPKP